MVIVSAMIALYYNVIIAVCIYYFFASMTSKLPWSACDDYSWASCYCRDNSMNATDSDPWNGTRLECGKKLRTFDLQSLECFQTVKWFKWSHLLLFPSSVLVLIIHRDIHFIVCDAVLLTFNSHAFKFMFMALSIYSQLVYLTTRCLYYTRCKFKTEIFLNRSFQIYE